MNKLSVKTYSNRGEWKDRAQNSKVLGLQNHTSSIDGRRVIHVFVTEKPTWEKFGWGSPLLVEPRETGT